MSQSIDVAEIACCESTHKGKWYGDWEPCYIISRDLDDGTVKVLCISDNLQVTVKSQFIRALRKWRCTLCTFVNGRTPHCSVCLVGVRPGTNMDAASLDLCVAARSSTPVTSLKRQRCIEETDDTPIYKFQKTEKFVIHEVAACDASHKGSMDDVVWEGCIVLKQDEDTCDVEILEDGAVCRQIPNKFYRQRTFELAAGERKWM